MFEVLFEVFEVRLQTILQNATKENWATGHFNASEYGFSQLSIIGMIAAVVIFSVGGFVGYEYVRLQNLERSSIELKTVQRSEELMPFEVGNLVEPKKESEDTASKEEELPPESPKPPSLTPPPASPKKPPSLTPSVPPSPVLSPPARKLLPEEALQLLAKTAIDFRGENRGLFSTEPFKSNKNKFNFWYVNKFGSIEDCKSVSGECNEAPAIQLAENCTVPDKYIVSFVDSVFAASGSGGRYATIGAALSPDLYLSLNKTAIGHLFTHEFGGHSFGRLIDEYVLSPNEKTENVSPSSIFSEQKNCYAGPQHTIAEAIEYAPWKHLIGNGCGRDGILDCLPGDQNYQIEIGVFEGCGKAGLGTFRSTRNSIMNDVDTSEPYSFGAWNERLIKAEINKINEEFVNQSGSEAIEGLSSSAIEVVDIILKPTLPDVSLDSPFLIGNMFDVIALLYDSQSIGVTSINFEIHLGSKKLASFNLPCEKTGVMILCRDRTWSAIDVPEGSNVYIISASGLDNQGRAIRGEKNVSLTFKRVGDSSLCKEVLQDHNQSGVKRANIVFVGFGY